MTHDEEEVVQTVVESGRATVVLNRPAALNAITVEMLERLERSLAALSADDAVQVVVLTGAGRAFSAGVDLKALGGRALTGGSVGEVLDGPARRVVDRLTTMEKIVIARVNGACFTGALELALACDLVVVAADAKLGDTHARWGLRPTWGMSARLWRAVGITKARELSYTARTFSGTEAAAWGLAVTAVPVDALDGAVDELVLSIGANSPEALAAYKALYRRSVEVGLSDGLAEEAASTFEISDTEERLAAFR